MLRYSTMDEKSRRDESILRDLSLVLTGGREEDDPEPNICAGARNSDERAKPMRKVSKEGAGGVSTSHLDMGSVSMYSNSANDEEYQYGEPTLGSNGTDDSSESNIIAISTESSDFSYGGEKMVFSQKKKGRNEESFRDGGAQAWYLQRTTGPSRPTRSR